MQPITFAPTRAIRTIWAPSRDIKPRGGQLATAVTVLVVDDQQDLADVTVEILKAYGMNAVAAYSADEALAILRGADNIDAMLSDIMMPGTNGIELANTAVAELPHLKVVLTSGYVFGSAALQTHGFPFFNKPYNMQAVLAHILDGSASAD